MKVTKRQIAAGIGIIPWAGLLYSGVDICLGAAAQGVRGLPNNGQLGLYIATPATATIVGLILLIYGGQLSLKLFLPIYFLMIFMLLPTAMLFGGGV